MPKLHWVLENRKLQAPKNKSQINSNYRNSKYQTTIRRRMAGVDKDRTQVDFCAAGISAVVVFKSDGLPAVRMNPPPRPESLRQRLESLRAWRSLRLIKKDLQVDIIG